MSECYVLDKKCPRCFGHGRIVNLTHKKLTIVEKPAPEKLDDPLPVCTECNGTGIILPKEVKELLEYILS